MRTSILALFLLLSGVLSPYSAHAQKKARQQKQAICDKARAIDLVGKQIEAARSIERTEWSIKVTVKGAELLWTYNEKQARAILADAYTRAERDYEAKGDQSRRDGQLLIQLPDQRFVVLSAIARRDAAWAKRLIESLPDYSPAASTSSNAPAVNHSPPPEKIIGLGLQLEPINRQASLSLARASFRYSAAYNLSAYLFTVAKSDKSAADGLFLEALAAYSLRTVNDLLYLSPYALGFRRTAGQPRGTSGLYSPPSGFVPSPNVEAAFIRSFVQICNLLFRPSLAEQVFTAISSIEPIVVERYPDLVAQVTVLKTQASAALTDSARSDASDYAKSLRGDESPREQVPFDKQIENLEKIPDPDRRDHALATMLAVAAATQPIDAVVKAAEKVTDKETARQLIDWIYYSGTQKLINDGELTEATKLAQKVGEIDQRATLLAQIASKSLDSKMDRTQASEALEAAYSAANKAPDSAAKARALLGVAALFAPLDRLRSSEVIGTAVKTINKLEEPDLSSKFITRRIEGKTGAMFGSAAAQDFTIESSFAKYGAEDFDGALWAAQKLEDKYLHSIAVLSLATQCLDGDSETK